MYLFVFAWTPVLNDANAKAMEGVQAEEGTASIIPHGLIFATFMVCVLIGGNVFTFLSAAGSPCQMVFVLQCV